MAETQTQGHPDSGGAGHELTDVPLRPLIVFVVGLLVAGALVFLGLGGWVQLYAARESSKAGLPSLVPPPIRMGVEEPPLQASPHSDLVKMRREERAILDSSAHVDREAGLVRIPIDDAMRLLLEQGLPTRSSGDTTIGGETREPGLPDATSGRSESDGKEGLR